MSSKMQEIAIELITVGERYRKDYGDLDELAANIREKGILQPITVDTNFNLLAGGRRITAAKIAELTMIPALVRETEGALDALEVELFENIHRKDMTWPEKVTLTARIDQLYKEKNPNWSGKKTAEAMNKSVGGVHRHLQLAEAIEAAPELAKCKTEDDAVKLMKKATQHMRVRRLVQEQEKKMESLPMVKHADTHFKIGDAFEGMQEMADLYTKQPSAIKLIEVDPPYGIELNEVKKGDDKHTEYTEVPAEEYSDWLVRLCGLLYKCAAKDSWLIFWYGPTWVTEVKNAIEGVDWKTNPAC